jgi:O-antigen/teichoic acid export membrane protein
MTSFSISSAVKTQLLKNAVLNSFSWGVTVMINLAAIPLLIRHLSVEGYGIYLLLTGIFGYFGLLDFGLSEGVVKYVAHHLELGNHDSVAESVNAALVVQVIAGVTGIAVLWMFNHQMIRALRVSSSFVPAASLGLYFSAVGFLFKMLLNTFNAALKGLQRFDVLARTTIGFSAAATIISVTVLFAGGGLLELIVVTVLMTAANLIAAVWLMFRFIPQYRLSFRISRGSFRSLFGFGAYTFITKVAGALNTYFLQIVIAVILGAGAVAYFAVPLRLTTGLEAGMGSLIGVIFPFVSTLKARENMESLQNLYSNASRYVVALSTPTYLFIILFSQQILRVWVGPSFAEKGWLVLAFLASNSLLASWTLVPSNTAFGTGDTKVTAAFSLIVTGLNLVFSILFTLKWGVTGTAAAVLLTAVQAPVFIWYVTSRVVRIPPRKYFARVFAFHIAPALGFALVSFGILWATKTHSGPELLIALTSGVALTAIYYSLLLRLRIVSASGVGWSG